jgi:hypothetical protein
MADTTWLEQYEDEVEECAEAKAKVALEPSPRVWPVSGSANPDATFNPNGYPVSVNKPPKRIVDPEVHDERTKDLQPSQTRLRYQRDRNGDFYV